MGKRVRAFVQGLWAVRRPQPGMSTARPPSRRATLGIQPERPTALATGMKTVRLECEFGCSIAPTK